MIYLIVAALAVGGVIVAGGGAGFSSGSFLVESNKAPLQNSMGWPDIDPSNQKGGYAKTFDDDYYNAALNLGVPFALLKAHAIRESSQNSQAFRQEPSGKASYGLMQVLWWSGSNRFSQWGYNDDYIGDGSGLYNSTANVKIAAQIILDNYSRLPSLRDCINAYNTGVAESVRVAPSNYVNDVLKYYSNIVGSTVT